MNNPLKIYSGANALLYTTPINKGCRRRVQLMTEDSITVKFSDENKMRFPVGTRIGDFYITKEQSERYNANTGGYDYELKFDAYYWLWANKLLFYVMPGVTNAPKETSFKLTAPIDVHAAVILRALNALGFTYDGSPFRVDTDEGFSTEAKYISYSNMSILGGIQAIADAYECEWWVVGNSIHFGKCNDIREYDFIVGDNVASITSDSKETSPNRLVVFGSTRNLPPDYRTTKSSDIVDAVVVKRLMLPEGTPYLQTSFDIPEDEIVEEEVVLDSIYPRTALSVTDVETYESTTDGMTQTFYRVKYGTSFLFSKDYILPEEELHVVFESGSLNGMDFAVRFNPLGVGEKEDDGTFNPKAQMLEIIANEDYGRALPDKVLYPAIGDKFSLYGWDSTKMADLGLLRAAEQELLEEGNKLIEEYRKDKHTYTCPMMWDWCRNQVNRNNSPKLGSTVNLHFTSGDSGRKSRIIGYEHDLDIEYSNVTYICGEKVSVSRLKTLESKVEGLTHTGEKVKVQNSLDFLSKRYSDRSPYQIASDKAIEVGDFLTGVSGAKIGKDAETGQTFGEMDRLFVRIKAYFETLTIINADSLAGEQRITPGGSVKCTSVRELDDVYRCYFLSEQDGEKTETKIIAGDQAIAQMFNAKTETSNKVSNHRYWRLVTAVSNDAYTDDSGNRYGYIDLSKADCEKGSDIPQAGDTIAQFGNRTDRTRQAAMMFSTVDADAPSIKLFTGIDSYSLAGKDIISYGYDPVKGNAYFNCYGDTYIGDPDGSTFIRYDRATKQLDIKAKLSVQSTFGDQTFEQWLTDHGYTDDTVANEALDAANDALIIANATKSEIDKYKYLANALRQDTQISGGLMMTTLISLGYTDEGNMRHTLAGMNGSWVPELGGRTIASWYGGEMIDLFDIYDNRITPAPPNAATSLTRMDGSAYFANGNIGFRADGSGWLGNDTNGIKFGRDGSITLGSGIKINLNGGDEGLKETVESLLNFNLGLSNLLKPCNAKDEEISWEEAAIEGRAKSLKAKLGLWTDEFLSARGKNEAGGGTGGLDIAMLEDYLTGNKYATQPWVTSALGNYYSKAEADARFLRQHQSLANYVTLGTAQVISGVKTFTQEVIATDKWITAKIITGETGAANNTVQSKKSHGIELGYPNRDYMNFNEFGGVFNFYKTNLAYTAASGNGTLVASITERGITAASFIRRGGTSSQFLKADGSVDSNTYLTSHQSLANYYTKSEVDAKDKRLVTYYPSRPTTANVNFGNNAGLYTFLATSSMTSGKPAGDGHILHMEWDNSLSWAGQIAVPNNGDMQWRHQRGNTWQAWRTILDSSNFNSLIGSGLTAYVRKAGDTMTGMLNIKMDTQPCLKLDSVTANKEVYMYVYSGGVAKTAVGWNNPHGSYIYNSPSNRYLGIKDNGTPHFQGNTLWHAGNDGARSGLDADLLDGFHKSDIYDNVTAKLSSLNDVLNSNGIRIYGFGYGDSASVANKPAGNSDARGTIGFGGIYCPMQLSWQYLGTDLYIRTKYSGNWQGWKRIAFTTDNVASATRLQTPRTLWGQSFDGTGNVNGAMTVNYTGETGILLKRVEADSGAFIRLYNNNQTTNYFRIGMYGAGYFGIAYNGADAIAILSNRCVGINTTAPGYTLDVNGSLHVRTLVYFDSTARINGDIWTNSQFFLNAPGYDQQPYMSGAFGKFNLAFHRNGVWVDTVMTIMPDGAANMTGPLHVDKGIYTEGYVTARGQNTSSDARLKDVTGNVELDIRAIARAPAVFFRWKDTGGEDVGSIAQYWQALMPQLTPRTSSGMLDLQYDKAALLGVVTVSRRVLDHEERIAALEAENASLKATIENMRGNA